MPVKVARRYRNPTQAQVRALAILSRDGMASGRHLRLMYAVHAETLRGIVYRGWATCERGVYAISPIGTMAIEYLSTPIPTALGVSSE